MKSRGLCVLTLSAFGFCSLLSVPAQGPVEKSAVLRSPFSEPSRTPAASAATPAAPAYLKDLFSGAKTANPSAPHARHLAHPDDGPDINADLKVTPAAGRWMIMIISYPGNEGAVRARKMCLEIKNTKRVPAYVFAYGAEERRKEYERVKKLYDAQQAFLKQENLTFRDPPRFQMRHIDVQHAVLVGGYPDDEAANKALVAIKRWPRPDKTKVDLETKFYQVTDPRDPTKTVRAEEAFVNPFERAWACRNPTVKNTPTQEAKLDIAALRRLNADESLSLLHCKKPFTLAVKEFQTPHTVYDRGTPESIWEKVGIANPEQKDYAKLSAHSLGEMLRQLKLEAYVLHSKYSSTVTIGGFDGPNDPVLLSTQQTLASRFNQPPFTQAPYSQIQFFANPQPMPVPH